MQTHTNGLSRKFMQHPSINHPNIKLSFLVKHKKRLMEVANKRLLADPYTQTDNQQTTTPSNLWLTHWGWVTHICVSKLTIIVSDNGLSPRRRQATIWTSAGILLIGPLGTNFSEILIAILTFSFKKMRLKVSSAKQRPFCLGLNVLISCHNKTVPVILMNYFHLPNGNICWDRQNDDS